MNRVEKIAYDLLKNNPRIKFLVRNSYQSLFDLLPNKINFSTKPLQVKEGCFFGFHDITPFSSDDAMILGNRLLNPLRMPTKDDALELGYLSFTDGRLGDFTKLAETTAWNYHKGCRLQWRDNTSIIFNDAANDSLISRIVNLQGVEQQVLPFAIDSVSRCGRYASSFSYGRLEMLMPGYGYVYDDESFKTDYQPTDTGLFLADIDQGSRALVVSLDRLASEWSVPESLYKNSHFYVTHSLFSPDSQYLAFLVRATNTEDVTKRVTQLAVYDIASGKLYFSPTDNMVSHYVWNDNNQIVAYCRTDGVDSHVLFKEPTLEDYQRVAYPVLNSDGHQSFINNEQFITDTYPDKYRMAHIYKVDARTDEVELIASLNSFKKFQSILPYKHWCCDLHPRVSHSGKYLCFDSVHTGERGLCVMEL